MRHETNHDLHNAVMDMATKTAEHLAKHEHPANYELLTHVDTETAPQYYVDARVNVTSH